MGKISEKVKVETGVCKDGIGITLQALFGGMEGLLQSKTVVGEPFEAGGATLIPLMEISAGLASGALQNNAHNNGAGAMSTKMTPIAILIIQNGRVRLVNIRDQDIFTRLLDLIPEAIDRIRKGDVSKDARDAAEEALEDMAAADPDTIRNIEVIRPEKAEEGK